MSLVGMLAAAIGAILLLRLVLILIADCALPPKQRRQYRSGSGWCFWRWSIVDTDYIRRLHIIKTPLFAVCLHWIRSADPEPYLHDHPVSFLSIILRGGYNEARGMDTARQFIRRYYRRRWFNFIRASTLHRITLVQPGTLTLALMGPKTREWGFYTRPGWVYWRDYYGAKRAGIAPEQFARGPESAAIFRRAF